MKNLVGLSLTVCVLVSCNSSSTVDTAETYEEYESALRSAYSRKPAETDDAVALMKDGVVTSWLATIHGYPNNREVCEELIDPYNADPSLSEMGGRYYCEPIVGPL